MKLGYLLLISVLISGCVSYPKAIREAAVRDFKCSEDEIEVWKEDGKPFWQAKGCNKTAEYSCGGCAFGPLKCAPIYR